MPMIDAIGNAMVDLVAAGIYLPLLILPAMAVFFLAVHYLQTRK